MTMRERTAHLDTFARDHLPPLADWPERRPENIEPRPD
jgi:hypothetical protein